MDRRRLESWKEIAAYLQRDVTTVQRWEKKEGLPVHRHVHDKLGSVYAFVDEVDGWKAARGTPPATVASAAGATPRAPLRRSMLIVVAALVILVAVVLLAQWRSTSSAPTIRSLAVLPLRNLTGDPQQEWLSDGITESLSSAFAGIRSLAVVSTTSTTRFKNVMLSMKQIAAELGGVDALVEGSVSRDADRVRVSLAVVDGRSERRLWVQVYERPISNLLDMTHEIANAAAAELRVVVSGDDRVRMQMRRRPEPLAYEAYLKGLHLRHRSHDGGCIAAEKYFTEAIALDAQFGEPHAEIALCYSFPDRHVGGTALLFDKATAAANAALALDERLGLPYSVLGNVALRRDYDHTRADKWLRHAAEMDPSNSNVQMALGEYLAITGRVDDGLAAARQSLKLNPLSPDQNVGFGHLLLRLGRIDEAVTHLQHTIELVSDFSSAWYWLSEALAQRGDHDAAVEARLRWLASAAVPERRLPVTEQLRAIYAKDGWRAFWQQELALATDESAAPGSVYRQEVHRYAYPAHLARRAARLQQWDVALAALQQAVADRHHLAPFIFIDPIYTRLRARREFAALAETMHLPLVPPS